VPSPRRPASATDRGTSADRDADAVDGVRRIIDAARPAALEDGGLAEALRKRVVAASSAGLEAALNVPSFLPYLPEDVVVAAYRIVDEALTNVLRHAGARHCQISIAATDSLVLEVRDDGRGWTSERAGGLGLVSMRRRAELLGGTFSASGADGGCVRVSLPLPARDAEPRTSTATWPDAVAR
jgi:signal transduction histidine kinase